MIAHVSVPSRTPQATALLFAALIDGEAFPFPVVPDAWIAIARDGSGTAVEVYPGTMAHHPGRGEVDPMAQPQGPQAMPWEDQIHPDGDQLRPSAFHIALSTRLDASQVLALARDAGLRAVPCERGGVFGLIELWLDNTHLIEVLTEPETARYRAFMNPAAASAMFGPGIAPPV
ncbi:MAG: hypothetical protein ACOY82_18955 [Pseudomonadota bacterium]